MTHNETRASWLREGAIGLGTGVLYGMTSVAVGHPFDTVKTKMQAQTGYLGGGGMVASWKKVWNAEGIRGLYRGCVPPMLGSGLYRSTQFAVFEALYTKWNDPFSTSVIPYTGGLQLRVVMAGFAASTARAVIECPIEYAKVARQTNQSWRFTQLFTGFPLQWTRTCGVMVTYFCLIDSIRRWYPRTFDHPAGQFLASAGSATLGFWIVWPFEVLKNQVQAGTSIGEHGTKATLRQRCQYLIQTHGVTGLYRGLWPGTIRSMVSNGFSMIVMIQAQKKVTEWGWRNTKSAVPSVALPPPQLPTSNTAIPSKQKVAS